MVFLTPHITLIIMNVYNVTLVSGSARAVHGLRCLLLLQLHPQPHPVHHHEQEVQAGLQWHDGLMQRLLGEGKNIKYKTNKIEKKIILLKIHNIIPLHPSEYFPLVGGNNKSHDWGNISHYGKSPESHNIDTISRYSDVSPLIGGGVQSKVRRVQPRGEHHQPEHRTETKRSFQKISQSQCW